MILLAYDTETTGIDQPNLVQLGAVLIDDGGAERGVVDLVVRPDGWTIPDEAARIHGIDHELAMRVGVPLIVAISVLTNLWAVADLRVAHNLEYDDKVIDRAMTTLGRSSSLRRPDGICTMHMAAPVLNLPPTERMIAAGYGDKPKSPSLAETYRFLFGEEIIGAHSALVDARAAARVYLYLIKGRFKA